MRWLALLCVACQPAASPLDALGEMRSIAIAEDAAGPARVTLFLARGRLTVSPRAAHTVSGTVRTNLVAFEPVVERTKTGIEISQRTRDVERNWPRGAETDWRIALGQTPVDLFVSVHTVETAMDLGGVALRSLSLRGDSGAVLIRWSKDNPLASRIDIATFVGPIELRELGRSRAADVRVRNLVGPITVDFGARVERDVVVRIEGMTSPVEVVVPQHVSATAFVTTGMGVVNARGWTQDENRWRAGSGSPRVTVHIRSAQGPVELTARTTGSSF